MIIPIEQPSPTSGRTKRPASRKKSHSTVKPAGNALKKPRTEKPVPGSPAPDWKPKDCSDNPQLKQQSPRKETSEDVEEFIKQVSSPLEKKNLFKETADVLEKSIAESPPAVSVTRDNALRNSKTERKTETKMNSSNNNSVNQKNLKEKQRKEEKLPPSPRKGSRRSPERKKGQMPKDKTKPCYEKVEKRRTVPETANGKTKPKGKSAEDVKVELAERPGGKPQKRDTPRSPERAIEVTSSSTAAEHKKLRRSEIPLRKDRPDLMRKTKDVSLLMQKSLKEVDSSVSVDFRQRKKAFSPIEEISLGSLSFESQNKETVTENCGRETPEGTLEETEWELGDDIQLNRCSKCSNIPDFSNNELANKQSGTECKVKVLDLEKVKDESITTLITSTALYRLETLHQKNMYSKENAYNEKAKKTLSPRPFVNTKAGCKPPSRNEAVGKHQKELEEDVKETAQIPNGKTKPEEAKSITMTKQHPKKIDRQKSPVQKKQTRVSKEIIDLEVKDPDSLSKLEIETQMSKTLEESVVDEADPEILELVAEFLSLQRVCDNKMKSIFDQETENVMPSTPPPTPEDLPQSEAQTTEPFVADNKPVVENPAAQKKSPHTPVKAKVVKKPKAKKTKSLKYTKLENLVVRGESIKFPSKHPDDSEGSEESDKVKVQIKIDMNTQGDATNNEVPAGEPYGSSKDISPPEWVSMEGKRGLGEFPEDGSTDARSKKSAKTEVPEDKRSVFPDSVKLKDKQTEIIESLLGRTHRSSSWLKAKSTPNPSATSFKSADKKMRSDAGDRRFISKTHFSFAISFQNNMNKIKPDAKLRSGLTKSYNREVKADASDIFEDTASIKLRRRSSEPNSFRGFVWKRADVADPRGHKASVSSMASSLRHLNTDEMEDFIFWEALPQKKTSCWEMSLYNIKRPWSVLSCSVFKDNRQSSTPGLILSDLRNGGAGNAKQSLGCESVSIPKENSFDVEPSIAQKNIDIKNWLAALNFPTLPSTSPDAITERSCPLQSPMARQNMSSIQVCQRRRKVIPGLKFSEQAAERRKPEKKRCKESRKWDPGEVGDLMELIRRKSGGFVTAEQFLNPEVPTRPQNVTVNFCTCKKSIDGKRLFQRRSRGSKSRLRLLKSAGMSSEHKVSKTLEVPAEVPASEEPQKSAVTPEKGLEEPRPADKVPQEHFPAVSSGINVWKYLFLLNLFIITVYYFFFFGGTFCA